MSYTQLLKTNTTFRKISTIQLVAYFATWFTNVAIFTMLVKMGVSEILIGIVTAMHFIPSFIQAPFTGAIIDKVKLKKLMYILLSVETLSTFALLFIDNKDLIWLLLIVIYIRMAASSFSFNVHMSLLPTILEADELKLANELHSIIWAFSYTAGMAISGVVVYKFGVKVAIFLDFLLFVSLFFVLYGVELKEKIKSANESFFKMINNGLVYLKENRLIIHLMIIHSSIAITVFDLIVTLLAKNRYKEIIAVPLAIGFLNASRAFALMIGAPFLSKFTNKYTLFYLFIFNGIATIIWGYIIDNFYLSLIGSFIAGFFTTTLWSYTYTLIQKNTNKEYYGRVVAYNDMLFTFIVAFSSILIGYVADKGVGVNYIIYMIGGTFIFVAFYYSFVLKKFRVKG